MYAIIEDSGSQIRVSEGDVIRVALRDLPADAATVTFDRVLFVSAASDEGQARVGVPYVEGVKVTGDVVAQEKTDRVQVVKFRRRKNYRRWKGHRQDYLKVKVTSIQG